MERVKNDHLLKHYLDKYQLYKWYGESIMEIAELHYYQSGEVLFEIGEQADYLYTLVNGRVKVTYPFENGKSMVLKVYSPLIMLGDMELFESKPIMCAVEVLEDCHLIGVPRRFIDEHWMYDVNFLRDLLASLSEKLGSTINNSSYNFVYPLSNRLASYIVEHLDKQMSNNIESTLEIQTSFEEIAQFLGTTYRHLHRTLNELEGKGLIEVQNKTLKIKDEEGLRILAVNRFMKLT